MYFLLYLPLHKRQALSPIEEKPIQQRESAFSSKRNPPRMQSQKEPPHDSPEKDRRARSSKGILLAISPTRNPLHMRLRKKPPCTQSKRIRRAFSPERSLRTCGPTRDPLRMQLRKRSSVPQPSKGTAASAMQECTSHPKNFDTSSIKIQPEIKLSYYTKSK